MSLSVAFIGFGEVAASFAKALVERDVEVRAYDVLFEQPEGRERLEGRAAGAPVAFLPLAAAIEGAHFVFSTVTTTVAEKAARSCVPHLRPGQVYLDFNATEPSLKGEIARIIGPSGAEFVEGAVLGAVGVTGARTEILLGGPHAERAARALADQVGLNVRFYSAEIGRASTFKMLRSVFSKGLEALLLEFLVAGERAGIREDLWREVTDLFEANRFERVAANWVCSHAVAHERRHHEMVDVAGVLRRLGVDPVMTDATVAMFERSGKLGVKNGFSTRPERMEDVIRFLERHSQLKDPG